MNATRNLPYKSQLTALLLRAEEITQIDAQRIYSKRRNPAIVRARWACWTALRFSGFSYSAVARSFGRPTHSTVHKAVKKYTQMTIREPAYSKLVWQLVATLHQS